MIAEYTEEKSQYYYRGTSLIGYIGQDTQKYFYRKNVHGNIISVLDSTGKEIRSYEYDAFGNQKKGESLKPLGKNTFTQIQKRNADYDTNPFRYCGEYYDNETGNIYLRNRYYDSETGRFTQQDIAKDGLNWYVYCNNNPIMFVDPWGLVITKEDRNAYESGTMSQSEWELLNNADVMWQQSKNDDYSTKALAHNMAYIARTSYKGQFQDDFDYTFGTKYSALDQGDAGSYMQTSVGYSSDKKISATTIIYYNRVNKNGRMYIEFLNGSGYASGNSKEKIYAKSIEYRYGFTSLSSSELYSGKSYNSVFKLNLSDNFYVFDDQGEYFVTGMNATFKFSSSNRDYYINVINNVYDKYYIDENNKISFEFDIPLDILSGRSYFKNKKIGR